jgi:hypothetical protein
MFSQTYNMGKNKYMLTDTSICGYNNAINSCLYKHKNYVDSISITASNTLITYYFKNFFLSEIKIFVNNTQGVSINFDRVDFINIRDMQSGIVNLISIHDTNITYNNNINLILESKNDTINKLKIACGLNYTLFLQNTPSGLYEYESYLLNNTIAELNSPIIRFDGGYRLVEYEIVRIRKKSVIPQLWVSFSIYDRMRMSLYNKKGKVKEEKTILY